MLQVDSGFLIYKTGRTIITMNQWYPPRCVWEQLRCNNAKHLGYIATHTLQRYVLTIISP